MFARLLIGLGFLALSVWAHAGQTTPLAPAPDWGSLDGYQRTITRGEFTRLIDQVYSTDGAFWRYATIDDDKMVLYSDTAKRERLFTLHFAPSEGACVARPYSYKTTATSTDPSRPLAGIRIALDPGIGRNWRVATSSSTAIRPWRRRS
jgi:hypothetical protein